MWAELYESGTWLIIAAKIGMRILPIISTVETYLLESESRTMVFNPAADTGEMFTTISQQVLALVYSQAMFDRPWGSH